MNTSPENKIAIVICDDLATWQRLNVTAFLTSGLIGAAPGLLGKRYQDGDMNNYNARAIQPMIVRAADAAMMRKIYERALSRDASLSIYIEEMFSTGHDEANRAAVAAVKSADLNPVGLALNEPRKSVDKVTKGAKMHP